MIRHAVTLPGFGALKGFSASGWADPGADFKISGPNVAAWKIVPGPTRGGDVATTWRGGIGDTWRRWNTWHCCNTWRRCNTWRWG